MLLTQKTKQPIYSICLAVALATAFLCCKNNAGADKASQLAAKRKAHFETDVLPQIKQHINDGDIIFRLGTDITSYLFATLNETDKRFSHSGVVSFENNQWYVYHAIGGELNPNQTMWREPLEWFAAPIDSKSIGLFDCQLSPSDKKHFLGIVKGWYSMKLPFDMEFDLKTNDKMYCTEMVAKALMVAKGESSWLIPTRQGGRVYINTENLTRSDALTEKGYWIY